MTTGTLDTMWSAPPRVLRLEDDELHVWRATVDYPAARVQELRHTLSADECARAERFYLRRDHDRFVIRRALLRCILGRYLTVDPDRLQFRYGAHGKPELAPPYSEAQLRFNVSHSAGLALYAVARRREIGVDLEAVQPATAQQGIAEQFFTSREVAALRALPPEAQADAFFSNWTRKEAYVKATGEGLAALSATMDAPEAASWSVEALALDPGYAAALVVEGRVGRLTCWQWTD